MGSSKNSQPSGFKYFMSLHMALCRGPIDALVQIQVDQKIAWSGNLSTGTQTPTVGLLGSPFSFVESGVPINKPYLFGGDTQEGGIDGGFNFYQGTADQVMESTDKNLMGQNSPEFRGIAAIFYTGQIASNNPYLKTWKFRARRSQNGWDPKTGCWYPEKATISIETCILYFYNPPLPGTYVNLNGKKITFVGQQSGSGQISPGAGQVTIVYGDIGATLKNFATYVSANASTYGVFAEQVPTIDQGTPFNPKFQGQVVNNIVLAQIILTTVNPQPSNSVFTVSTNGTNSNPAVGSPTLRGGGIKAMNGAHILYEVCTNTVWGRGIPVTFMDDVAFRRAADRLYNEGFGLCIKWSQQDTLASFIQEIVSTISAALYFDRNTGLMTIRLLRQDYDPSNIPHFDAQSGLLGVESDAVGARAQAYNEVIVNFHDPIADLDQQIRSQDLSSFVANAATLSKTMDFKGVPTPALAALIAQRELLQQISGLKKFVVKLDRSGRFLGPGDVFTFTDPTRNIANIVMRVAKIEDGTPIDQTITLNCLQDVFSLPATAYMSQNKQSGWTPPANIPTAISQASVTEATYRDMAYYLTAANFAAFSATSGGVSVLAVNPGLVSGTYRLASAVAPSVPVPGNNGVYTFGAQLQNPVGLSDTQMVLQNMQNVGLLNPAATSLLFLLGSEWVNCTAFDLTTGIFTIARGCVDTVPIAHLSGEDVYLADYNEGSDNTEYVVGETVDVQLLPLTSQGYLDQSSAPILSVPIVGRHAMPYPPGQVALNGTPFYDTLPRFLAVDIVVVWASRNRVIQADVLIDQTGASVTPEPGTTYTIAIIFNNVTVRTVTGIAALTWTYTQAMQNADGVSGLAILTLQSELNGLSSYTKYEIPFANANSGWNDAWGIDWDSE